MIARLQQFIVCAWVLIASAWLICWWDRSLAIAFMGIGALTLAHTAVLAIEFIASRHANRRGPPPYAGGPQYLRAWWAESRVALRVFCWRQPFRAQAVPDHLRRTGLRGVVLLHGFLCNRAFWNPWLRVLKARDQPFISLSLEPVFGSIDSYASAIDRAIADLTEVTGRPPVVLCHSMGGLAARAWLRGADGARVHRIVTIGTPHGGTGLARLGYSVNGRQMRPGGEWLQRIDHRVDGSGVSGVAFTCWYSNCDNIVFPASSATLPGADNRLAAGLAHVEMAFDPRLMRETLALLDAT